FQAEDGIRDRSVTGVQTCALPISARTAATTSSCVVGTSTCCGVQDTPPLQVVRVVVHLGMGLSFGAAGSRTGRCAGRDGGVDDRSEERRVGKERGGQDADGESQVQ